MRTVLICHEEDRLNRIGLARWMGSFSDLAGVVVLRETSERKRRRVKREIERVGWLRFADVLAFRAYYSAFIARRDSEWEHALITRLCTDYADPHTKELITSSPNTPEAEAFIRECAPDVIIARCKTLIASRIFTIAKVGTFVMHPGICPEYRNAHGCFWAVANGDIENVGMTLLKIDKGIDTGPVYGYFRVRPRPDESHIVLQHRSVFDNLAEIRAVLERIAAGKAMRLDTAGRNSAEWGQPWLTRYFDWTRVLRNLPG